MSKYVKIKKDELKLLLNLALVRVNEKIISSNSEEDIVQGCYVIKKNLPKVQTKQSEKKC